MGDWPADRARCGQFPKVHAVETWKFMALS